MVSKILFLIISDYWSVYASECFKRIGQSVIEHALTFLYLFIHDKQLCRRLKAQHSLFKSKSITNKTKPPPSPYLAC